MGGSEPILTLCEFRNPYGKMDRPLGYQPTYGLQDNTNISAKLSRKIYIS